MSGYNTVVIILCGRLDQVPLVQSLDAAMFNGSNIVVVLGKYMQKFQTSFACTMLLNDNACAGFDAGRSRDIGLAYTLDQFPTLSSVLFIDGDCTPQIGWFRNHMEVLNAKPPVVSCGVRLEDWRVDARTLSETRGDTLYTPTLIPNVVNSATLTDITNHRATWSCNMGINAHALALVRSAALKVHGSTRVFPPIFDGLWGGEDTSFGVLANLSGCEVKMTNEAAVFHTRHSPAQITVKNLIKVPEYVNQAMAILS